MAIDPATGTMIVAGVNAALSGANMISQGNMNRKTQRFAREMYDIQRKHNLEDWQMQNEFNDPKNQMQRLKAAGLNPNLVYGKGADVTAGSIQSANAPAWNPKAPQADNQGISQSLAGYFDARVKTEQANNMEKQNQVLEAQKVKTIAETNKILSDIDTSKFDLYFKKKMEDVQTDYLKMQVDKMIQENAKIQQDMLLGWKQDQRADQTQEMSLKEAAERIKNMRTTDAKMKAEIDLLLQDGRLKQFDEEMQKIGIHRNSPWWFKFATEWLGRWRKFVRRQLKNDWEYFDRY